MQFQHFDIDRFLGEHWQKQPLLIRNPWAAWSNPVDPSELAGLACEEDVESRLIEQKSKGWRVSHGPFPESRFAKLGKRPWTLLVQAVDQHVPDVTALLEPFRFVPNWRVDDVMVSYASDGGGVGPHYDHYDVFLIQGLGRRRWRVGGPCDGATPLLPHDDLRLLAAFEAREEWVLEPGDILYLPPGFAHDGVAIGEDCMTYSVGFRAPSRADLISDWCDHLVDGLEEEDRYADPDLVVQGNPGEIAPAAIDRLHALVTERLADRDAFARWFGTYNSAPKYADRDWAPEEAVAVEGLREALDAGVPLVRNPASRFSFVRREAGAVILFVDGQSFDCAGDAAALAMRICAHGEIGDVGGAEALALVAALVDQGSLALDEGE